MQCRQLLQCTNQHRPTDSAFVTPTLFLLIVWEHVGELADDAEHDLVHAAPDRHQPQVAVQPRHVDVFGEAHPAPELQARVGHLPDSINSCL